MRDIYNNARTPTLNTPMPLFLCGPNIPKHAAYPNRNMKKHQCYSCGRCFVRREHLQRHERCHTKEKPYICSQCPQMFSRRDLLTRHIRFAHAPVVETQNASSVPHQLFATFPSQPVAPTETPPATGVIRTIEQPAVLPWQQRSEGDSIMVSDINPRTSAAADEVCTSNVIPLPFNDSAIIEGTNNDIWHAVESIFSQEFTASALGNSAEMSASFTAQDYTTFLDSITLANNPFTPSYAAESDLTEEADVPGNYSQSCLPMDSSDQDVTHTEGSHLFSTFNSRLPSLQPDESRQVSSSPTDRKCIVTKVSPECRRKFVSYLADYSNVIPKAFVLPSFHALSRFVKAYISGFNEHNPVLHLPTLSMECVSLELFLSIAAIGARYCREPDRSFELFRIAKAVALEKIRRQEAKDTSSILASRRREKAASSEPQDIRGQPFRVGGLAGTTSDGDDHIHLIQALLLLVSSSIWSERAPPIREALSLRSVLDALLRDHGLKSRGESGEDTWETWARVESVKRTKFVAFCIFNLQTIMLDIPPQMLSTEIHLNLPCTDSEWKATDGHAWKLARQQSKCEPSFQDILSKLFKDDGCDSNDPAYFSCLGGYILIHAIIQHIWLIQQTSRLQSQPEYVLHTSGSTLLNVLRRWSQAWERSQESSMDPISPHGPMAFTSTALLRLAHVRINMDTSSVRALHTWDPHRIALSLSQSPSVQRNDRLTRAALHCAHALSIPIKLGLNFVAYTQIFYWSNQHALCSLECALLLSKWLEAVTVPNLQPPLTDDEARLLRFVVHLVEETDSTASQESHEDLNLRRLSGLIVRIWTKVFSAGSVWDLVDLVGRSMNAYADILEGHGSIE